MKIVTEVRILETPDTPTYTFAKLIPSPITDYAAGFTNYPISDPSYETEIVRRYEFIDANGNTVYFGMTREAQDSLGLYMDAFETQQNEIQKLNKALTASHRSFTRLLIEIDTQSFWHRLKYLVTGKLSSYLMGLTK